MSVIQLPSAADVDGLFDMLYGRDTTVTRSSVGMGTGTKSIRLSFVDDQGTERLMCISDLSAAASLGAALTMIPPAQAQADAQAGVIREAIIENLAEVANVMSSMFQNPGAEPLTLAESPLTIGEADPAPDEGQTVTFDVRLPGYEGGLIAFRAA